MQTTHAISGARLYSLPRPIRIPSLQPNHTCSTQTTKYYQRKRNQKPRDCRDFFRSFQGICFLQYDKLFYKLNELGFSKHTLTWFQSYLSDRKQVVDLNRTISHQLDMNLRVPQGSILGPILFLLYVNDINNCDTNTKFVKFADDTTVITSAPTLQEASWRMNMSMEKVYTWFQSNKLNLNPSKTRYMIFNLSLIHI